ncbi:MAG TPA: hypothetical protein VHD87_01225 [Acidimicrobiales bacterium]|nr:hypothetical protein [Acidimicrobiales bacterium]
MKPRALLALALGAVSLTACGPKTHLHLSMRTESITVPRLVTPAIELVAPADVPTVTFPEFPSAGSLLPALPPAPPGKVGCPTADEFATPEVPATLEVTAPPAEQTATQLEVGAYSTSAGQSPLVGVVTETIKHLPSSKASNGQRVDAWTVERVDAAHKTRWVEIYQLVHSSSALGATSGGVYLVGLAWDDPVLGKLRFDAVGNGVQVLPSPVQRASNNVQYAGAATDPSTLTTVAIVRDVRGRKNVDACGDLIDAWTVEMTGTVTTTTWQRALTWTQRVATGYGAADVEDTFTVVDPRTQLLWTRTVRNTALPTAVTP